AVRIEARVLDACLPEDELRPTGQAVARVLARLGEKRNRARARIKFLIAHLGIDQFRQLVDEERRKLSTDPRWTAYLSDARGPGETPLKAGTSLKGAQRPEGLGAWYATDVYQQRQAGYVRATITLPLGDIPADHSPPLPPIP